MLYVKELQGDSAVVVDSGTRKEQLIPLNKLRTQEGLNSVSGVFKVGDEFRVVPMKFMNGVPYYMGELIEPTGVQGVAVHSGYDPRYELDIMGEHYLLGKWSVYYVDDGTGELYCLDYVDELKSIGASRLCWCEGTATRPKLKVVVPDSILEEFDSGRRKLHRVSLSNEDLARFSNIHKVLDDVVREYKYTSMKYSGATYDSKFNVLCNLRVPINILMGGEVNEFPDSLALERLERTNIKGYLALKPFASKRPHILLGFSARQDIGLKGEYVLDLHCASAHISEILCKPEFVVGKSGSCVDVETIRGTVRFDKDILKLAYESKSIIPSVEKRGIKESLATGNDVRYQVLEDGTLFSLVYKEGEGILDLPKEVKRITESSKIDIGDNVLRITDSLESCCKLYCKHLYDTDNYALLDRSHIGTILTERSMRAMLLRHCEDYALRDREDRRSFISYLREEAYRFLHSSSIDSTDFHYLNLTNDYHYLCLWNYYEHLASSIGFNEQDMCYEFIIKEIIEGMDLERRVMSALKSVSIIDKQGVERCDNQDGEYGFRSLLPYLSPSSALTDLSYVAECLPPENDYTGLMGTYCNKVMNMFVAVWNAVQEKLAKLS